MCQVLGKLAHIVSHVSPRASFCCYLTAFVLVPTERSLQSVRDAYHRKLQASASGSAGCCSNCASNTGSCLKRHHKDEENREINVATLYEVERQCSLLTPDHLKPESNFSVLMTLCVQFLKREKMDALRRGRVSALCSGIARTVTVPAVAVQQSVGYQQSMQQSGICHQHLQRLMPISPQQQSCQSSLDAAPCNRDAQISSPVTGLVSLGLHGTTGRLQELSNEHSDVGMREKALTAFSDMRVFSTFTQTTTTPSVGQQVIEQLSFDMVQTLLRMIKSGQITPAQLSHVGGMINKAPNLSLEFLKNIVKEAKVQSSDNACLPCHQTTASYVGETYVVPQTRYSQLQPVSRNLVDKQRHFGRSWQHQPQGMAQQHQPQGIVQQHHPQGIVQQHQPQGMAQQHQPQGIVQQHQPQGIVQQHQPQGMAQQHQPQGIVQQHQPHGIVQQHLLQGIVQQHQPQGIVQQHQPQAIAQQHQPQGIAQQHQPHCIVQQHQPQGIVQQHQPQGIVQQHQSLGIVQQHQPHASHLRQILPTPVHPKAGNAAIAHFTQQDIVQLSRDPSLQSAAVLVPSQFTSACFHGQSQTPFTTGRQPTGQANLVSPQAAYTNVTCSCSGLDRSASEAAYQSSMPTPAGHTVRDTATGTEDSQAVHLLAKSQICFVVQGTSSAPHIGLHPGASAADSSLTKQQSVPTRSDLSNAYSNRHYSIDNLLFTGEQRRNALSTITLPDTLPEISVDTISDTLRALNDRPPSTTICRSPFSGIPLTGNVPSMISAISDVRVEEASFSGNDLVFVPRCLTSTMPCNQTSATISLTMNAADSLCSKPCPQTLSEFRQPSLNVESFCLPSIDSIFGIGKSNMTCPFDDSTRTSDRSILTTKLCMSVGRATEYGCDGHTKTPGHEPVGEEVMSAMKGKRVISSEKGKMMDLVKKAMAIHIEHHSLPTTPGLTYLHSTGNPPINEATVPTQQSSLCRSATIDETVPYFLPNVGPMSVETGHRNSAQSSTVSVIDRFPIHSVIEASLGSSPVGESLAVAQTLPAGVTLAEVSRTLLHHRTGVITHSSSSVFSTGQHSSMNLVSQGWSDAMATSVHSSSSVLSSTPAFVHCTAKSNMSPTGMLSPCTQGIQFSRQLPSSQTFALSSINGICVQTSASINDLDIVASKDQPIATFRCIICANAFASLDDLRHHVKQVCEPDFHQSSPASDCRTAFPKASDIPDDSATSTVFQCMRCFELCISQAGIRQHKLMCSKPDGAKRKKTRSRPKPEKSKDELAADAKVMDMLNKCLCENRDELRAEIECQRRAMSNRRARRRRRRTSPDDLPSAPAVRRRCESTADKNTPCSAASSVNASVRHWNNDHPVMVVAETETSDHWKKRPSHIHSANYIDSITNVNHVAKGVCRGETITPGSVMECSDMELACSLDYHASTTGDQVLRTHVAGCVAVVEKRTCSYESDIAFPTGESVKAGNSVLPKYQVLTGHAGLEFFKCNFCQQTFCSVESCNEHATLCCMKQFPVQRLKPCSVIPTSCSLPREDILELSSDSALCHIACPSPDNIAVHTGENVDIKISGDTYNATLNGSTICGCQGNHMPTVAHVDGSVRSHDAHLRDGFEGTCEELHRDDKTTKSVDILHDVCLHYDSSLLSQPASMSSPLMLALKKRSLGDAHGSDSETNQNQCLAGFECVGNISGFSKRMKRFPSGYQDKLRTNSRHLVGNWFRSIKKRHDKKNKFLHFTNCSTDMCSKKRLCRQLCRSINFCHLCQRFYPKRALFIEHLAMTHIHLHTISRTDDTFCFSCRLCRKVFQQFSSYLTHARLHSRAIISKFFLMSTPDHQTLLNSDRAGLIEMPSCRFRTNTLSCPHATISTAIDPAVSRIPVVESMKQRAIPLLSTSVSSFTSPPICRRTITRAAQRQALNKIHISLLGLTTAKLPLKGSREYNMRYGDINKKVSSMDGRSDFRHELKFDNRVEEVTGELCSDPVPPVDTSTVCLCEKSTQQAVYGVNLSRKSACLVPVTGQTSFRSQLCRPSVNRASRPSSEFEQSFQDFIKVRTSRKPFRRNVWKRGSGPRVLSTPVQRHCTQRLRPVSAAQAWHEQVLRCASPQDVMVTVQNASGVTHTRLAYRQCIHVGGVFYRGFEDEKLSGRCSVLLHRLHHNDMHSHGDSELHDCSVSEVPTVNLSDISRQHNHLLGSVIRDVCTKQHIESLACNGSSPVALCCQVFSTSVPWDTAQHVVTAQNRHTHRSHSGELRPTVLSPTCCAVGMDDDARFASFVSETAPKEPEISGSLVSGTVVDDAVRRWTPHCSYSGAVRDVMTEEKSIYDTSFVCTCHETDKSLSGMASTVGSSYDNEVNGELLDAIGSVDSVPCDIVGLANTLQADGSSKTHCAVVINPTCFDLSIMPVPSVVRSGTPDKKQMVCSIEVSPPEDRSYRSIGRCQHSSVMVTSDDKPAVICDDIGSTIKIIQLEVESIMLCNDTLSTIMTIPQEDKLILQCDDTLSTIKTIPHEDQLILHCDDTLSTIKTLPQEEKFNLHCDDTMSTIKTLPQEEKFNLHCDDTLSTIKTLPQEEKLILHCDDTLSTIKTLPQEEKFNLHCDDTLSTIKTLPQEEKFILHCDDTLSTIKTLSQEEKFNLHCDDTMSTIKTLPQEEKLILHCDDTLSTIKTLPQEEKFILHCDDTMSTIKTLPQEEKLNLHYDDTLSITRTMLQKDRSNVHHDDCAINPIPLKDTSLLHSDDTTGTIEIIPQEDKPDKCQDDAISAMWTIPQGDKSGVHCDDDTISTIMVTSQVDNPNLHCDNTNTLSTIRITPQEDKQDLHNDDAMSTPLMPLCDMTSLHNKCALNPGKISTDAVQTTLIGNTLDLPSEVVSCYNVDVHCTSLGQCNAVDFTEVKTLATEGMASGISECYKECPLFPQECNNTIDDTTMLNKGNPHAVSSHPDQAELVSGCRMSVVGRFSDRCTGGLDCSSGFTESNGNMSDDDLPELCIEEVQSTGHPVPFSSSSNSSVMLSRNHNPVFGVQEGHNIVSSKPTSLLGTFVKQKCRPCRSSTKLPAEATVNGVHCVSELADVGEEVPVGGELSEHVRPSLDSRMPAGSRKQNLSGSGFSDERAMPQSRDVSILGRRCLSDAANLPCAWKKAKISLVVRRSQRVRQQLRSVLALEETVSSDFIGDQNADDIVTACRQQSSVDYVRRLERLERSVKAFRAKLHVRPFTWDSPVEECDVDQCGSGKNAVNIRMSLNHSATKADGIFDKDGICKCNSVRDCAEGSSSSTLCMLLGNKCMKKTTRPALPQSTLSLTDKCCDGNGHINENDQSCAVYSDGICQTNSVVSDLGDVKESTCAEDMYVAPVDRFHNSSQNLFGLTTLQCFNGVQCLRSVGGCDGQRCQSSGGCDGQRSQSSDVCDGQRCQSSDGCDGQRCQSSDWCDGQRCQSSDGCDGQRCQSSDWCDGQRSQSSDGCDGQRCQSSDLCDGQRCKSSDGCDGQQCQSSGEFNVEECQRFAEKCSGERSQSPADEYCGQRYGFADKCSGKRSRFSNNDESHIQLYQPYADKSQASSASVCKGNRSIAIGSSHGPRALSGISCEMRKCQHTLTSPDQTCSSSGDCTQYTHQLLQSAYSTSQVLQQHESGIPLVCGSVNLAQLKTQSDRVASRCVESSKSSRERVLRQMIARSKRVAAEPLRRTRKCCSSLSVSQKMLPDHLQGKESEDQQADQLQGSTVKQNRSKGAICQLLTAVVKKRPKTVSW